jgi:hypothetical protein
VNHGCGGTNNVGEVLPFTELSLDYDSEPDVIIGTQEDGFDLQDIRAFPGWSTLSIADMNPGDEMLDNYLPFGGIALFQVNLRELKSFCSDMLVLGSVSQYEQARHK